MICPTCASQISPAVWKLVAAFVTAPLGILGVVGLVVWRAHRQET